MIALGSPPPSSMARRSASVILAALLLMFAASMALVAASPAKADSAVAVTATIEGVSTSGSSPAHAVILRPDQ